MSIYTAATIDKIIKPMNDSLTNTLSEYRKLDDLSIITTRLPIGSISSVSDSNMFNFDNINTASVEFSDEIYNASVHFVGKFVSVDDESNTYGFQPTYSVILKSASVGPTDSLVSKSQMIDYVPAIDSIFDAFNNSDPNPGMNPEE